MMHDSKNSKPAGTYLFKVNNTNTRTILEIYLKLTTAAQNKSILKATYSKKRPKHNFTLNQISRIPTTLLGKLVQLTPNKFYSTCKIYYLWHKLHAFLVNFNPSQLFKNQTGAFLNKRIIENRLEVTVTAWFVEISRGKFIMIYLIRTPDWRKSGEFFMTFEY